MADGRHAVMHHRAVRDRRLSQISVGICAILLPSLVAAVAFVPRRGLPQVVPTDGDPPAIATGRAPTTEGRAVRRSRPREPRVVDAGEFERRFAAAFAPTDEVRRPQYFIDRPAPLSPELEADWAPSGSGADAKAPPATENGHPADHPAENFTSRDIIASRDIASHDTGFRDVPSHEAVSRHVHRVVRRWRVARVRRPVIYLEQPGVTAAPKNEE